LWKGFFSSVMDLLRLGNVPDGGEESVGALDVGKAAERLHTAKFRVVALERGATSSFSAG